jgi:hypothetical protein
MMLALSVSEAIVFFRTQRTAFALILAALLACTGSDPNSAGPAPPLAPGQVLTTDATIRFVNIEGGCWAIQNAAGQLYEPINLARGFRIDGLSVRVVLRGAPDATSICMIGTLVTIDSVSRP